MAENKKVTGVKSPYFIGVITRFITGRGKHLVEPENDGLWTMSVFLNWVRILRLNIFSESGLFFGSRKS